MNYLNLFICSLELIPLLWNRFRTTFGDEKFYFNNPNDKKNNFVVSIDDEENLTHILFEDD